VAAVGPLAEKLTTGHPNDDPYGAGTPYARLVELGGKVVMLGAPLDTVTLVHHAEAIAEVPGKRRVSYRMPVLVDGRRVWRAFSDIDTGDGALPYGRVLGGEDYIEHIVGLTLVAGVGNDGPAKEATAYLFDAHRLLEHADGWIERTFPSGGAASLRSDG
jgi:aminoglycoside 3-N-acetyltransferase